MIIPLKAKDNDQEQGPSAGTPRGADAPMEVCDRAWDLVAAIDAPLTVGLTSSIDFAMARWFDNVTIARNALKNALEARSAPEAKPKGPDSPVTHKLTGVEPQEEGDKE